MHHISNSEYVMNMFIINEEFPELVLKIFIIPIALLCLINLFANGVKTNNNVLQ